MTRAETWQFVHVPKTGGTAIEDAGYVVGLRWGRFARFGPCAVAGTSHWHHPPALHPEVYAGHPLFAIAREPHARLVSDFRYLHRERAIGESLDPGGLNAFVARWLRDPPPGNVGNHLRPQTDLTHGAHPVDVILPFSTFPACADRFFAQVGLPIRIPGVVNATRRTVTVDDLTPASRAIIAEVYARDFDLLSW